MIVHKPVTDVSTLNFDKAKKGVRKAKNKIAPEDMSIVSLFSCDWIRVASLQHMEQSNFYKLKLIWSIFTEET